MNGIIKFKATKNKYPTLKQHHPCPLTTNNEPTKRIKPNSPAFKSPVSTTIHKTPLTQFNGNVDDEVLEGNQLAYSLQGIESFGSRVLDTLSHERIKNIILENFAFNSDYCTLVHLDESGAPTSPYFVSDFADLAMLPKVLKILLKNVLERSTSMPKEMIKLWQYCSPTLPMIRPCCVMIEDLETWVCYNNASKVQIVKIPNPQLKLMEVRIECETVSSNFLDGRRYKCFFLNTHLKVSDRVVKEQFFINPPTILMCNCQGVARPSFIKHFNELLHVHKPDIIVLLETRCSRKLLKDKLVGYSIAMVSTMENDDWYGGVVVLSMSSKLYFEEECNGKKMMDGKIRGITIVD